MSLNKRQLEKDNPRTNPISPKPPIYNLEKMRGSIWQNKIMPSPNVNLHLPQMEGRRPRMFNPYGFANMIPLGPNEQGLLLGAGVNTNIPMGVRNLNLGLGLGATNLTGFQRQGMKPLFNEFRVEPPRLSLRYNFEHGGDHPTMEERYQATLDWLNTNPYEGMPDWKKLEEVETSNYPSIGKSSGRMTIPIAGVTANPYDPKGKGYMYQPASMPADYGGLNIVMVNKEGSDYTYPMVVAPQDADTKTRKLYKEFNDRYLHTMQDPKFLVKDPTFHVYGRGLPYNPALQEQYYEQYPSMNPNTQTALVQRYGGQKYDHGGPHYRRGAGRLGKAKTHFKGKAKYYDPTTLMDMQRREFEAQLNNEHAREFYQGIDVGDIGDQRLMVPEYRLLQEAFAKGQDQNYVTDYLRAVENDEGVKYNWKTEDYFKARERALNKNVYVDPYLAGSPGSEFGKTKDGKWAYEIYGDEDPRQFLNVPMRYNEETGKMELVQDEFFGRTRRGKQRKGIEYYPVNLKDAYYDFGAPQQFLQPVAVAEKAEDWQKELHKVPVDKRREIIRAMEELKSQTIQQAYDHYGGEDNLSDEDKQWIEQNIDREQLYNMVKEGEKDIKAYNQREQERRTAIDHNSYQYQGSGPNPAHNDAFTTFNPLGVEDYSTLPANRAYRLQNDLEVPESLPVPDLLQWRRDQERHKRDTEYAIGQRFGTIDNNTEYHDQGDQMSWYDYPLDFLHSPGDFIDAFMMGKNPYDKTFSGLSYRDSKRQLQDMGQWGWDDSGIFGKVSDFINPANILMDAGHHIYEGDIGRGMLELGMGIIPYGRGLKGFAPKLARMIPGSNTLSQGTRQYLSKLPEYKGISNLMRQSVKYDMDKLINPAFRKTAFQSLKETPLLGQPALWKDIGTTALRQPSTFFGKNFDAMRRGYNIMKSGADDVISTLGAGNRFPGFTNPELYWNLAKNQRFRTGLNAFGKNMFAAPLHGANLISKPAAMYSLGDQGLRQTFGYWDPESDKPNLTSTVLTGMKLYNPFELGTGQIMNRGFYSRFLPISREADDLLVKGHRDFALGLPNLYQGYTERDPDKISSGVASIISGVTPGDKIGKAFMKNPWVKQQFGQHVYPMLLGDYQGTELEAQEFPEEPINMYEDQTSESAQTITEGLEEERKKKKIKGRARVKGRKRYKWTGA